jgi:hypothetical protein
MLDAFIAKEDYICWSIGILQNEFLSNTYLPEVHIDPQQRCAVLNFYSDKIAILPFRQSEDLGDVMPLPKDKNKRHDDDQSRYLEFSEGRAK